MLDDKVFDNQEMTLDKIQGSKAIIYSRNKIPLMFSPDIKSNVIFPSLYLLFKFQNLAKLGLFLKEGVETFVFKGADVMWPGVSHVNVEEFTQNDMVVVYA